MLTAYYTIISLALAVMIYALATAIRLRRVARGGKIGRVVAVLTGFIVFFLLGYLAGPFLPMLDDPAYGLMLTAVVFLFGALFVVLVLRIIEALVRKVFQELGME
jgi:hypothetical protein